MGAKTVLIFEVVIGNYNLNGKKVLISKQNREEMKSIKRKINKVDSNLKCRNKIHCVTKFIMETEENYVRK